MIELASFTKKLDIELTIAVIGINCEDWYCYDPAINMSNEEIRETMVIKGYDVIPISDDKGRCNKYFRINEDDDNKLECNKIEEIDKIYYLTHVRDVIWKKRKEVIIF